MICVYPVYKKTYFRTKDPHRLKVKGWEKIFQVKGHEKKVVVAIIISDKIDFKQGHKKRPRRSLHYTQGKDPSRKHKPCKYICTQHRSTQIHKENLGGLQEKYCNNTIIVGDFNTPLSTMDKFSKQRINKDIVPLNDTLDQVDLLDIYRIFHPQKTEYTFSSNAHGTF